MKKQIITLFLFISFLGFSQTEVSVINGVEFTFKTTMRDDTVQVEFMELYRGDKKLLSHVLSHFDGDCSSENIVLGTYQVVNNTIIFYSYWASGDRMGSNIYPYGFRKQIYAVDNTGKIKLVASALYIQTRLDTYEIHKGMPYLDKPPKTKKSLKLLNDYITKAEKKYDAKIVFGVQRKTLEKEIRKVLKDAIELNTAYWDEVYGNNCKK